MRFKICCIANSSEAALAIDYGGYAIGLVGKMPGGPGPIPDDLILSITRKVPPMMSTWCFYNTFLLRALIYRYPGLFALYIPGPAGYCAQRS